MSNEPIQLTIRRSVTTAVCVIAFGAAAGCDSGGADHAGSARGAVATERLVPTLVVAVKGDSVSFKLRVANDGDTTVVLRFETARRFDFRVEDGAGAEVWRWSAGRVFAQVEGTEAIEPDGVLEYEAMWGTGSRSGVYRAVASLEAARRVELGTEFEVGGG